MSANFSEISWRCVFLCNRDPGYICASKISQLKMFLCTSFAFSCRWITKVTCHSQLSLQSACSSASLKIVQSESSILVSFAKQLTFLSFAGGLPTSSRHPPASLRPGNPSRTSSSCSTVAPAPPPCSPHRSRTLNGPQLERRKRKRWTKQPGRSARWRMG